MLPNHLDLTSPFYNDAFGLINNGENDFENLILNEERLILKLLSEIENIWTLVIHADNMDSLNVNFIL
jgi:hypothetical protein